MFGRVLVLLSAFVLGTQLIKYFGSFYVNNVNGYERGNRSRLISVLKLEWVSFLLCFIVYYHLFSIFELPYTVFYFNSKSESLKRRWRKIFILIMLLSNMVYMFYFVNFELPWVIFEFCALLQGIWLHLVFFSLGFICFNWIISLISQPQLGHHFLEILYRCNLIRRIATETQIQVLITLISTLLLSTIEWYSSDKIVVRELTVPLHHFPVGSPPIKLAVIADLHGGGAVYREQIATVVDRANALDADAILLIGDTVDAPRVLIEKRMEPLKFLRSRLGTYFTTGNHEYYYGSVLEWIELYKSYGIKVLENQYELWKGVCLVGLNDVSSENSGIFNHHMGLSALSDCPRNSSIVVMQHNPAASYDIINYARNHSTEVELILSGHTHAGQYYILVPYVFIFMPFWHGLYHLNNGNTRLLVSAGSLYQAAPMKMWRMSEIWLVTLTTERER